LNLDLLFAATGSKFVPVIVTLVPVTPIVGVKLVMVGKPAAPTTNGVLLVTFPEGVVTEMGPVVAPAGTLVLIFVVVAAVTVAATPLNVTVFWLAVVLKPVP